MQRDLYTKAVLSVIAVALGVIAWEGQGRTVRAQSSEPRLAFDQEVRRIETPGGGSSLLGRVAIDLYTGNVYGFPTDGNPYPRDIMSDKPPVAKPILLGRFDVSALPQ